MKAGKVLQIIIVIAILAFVGFGQTETVEFGDGAKMVSRSFTEENKPGMFEISAAYPELQGFDPIIAAKFNQTVKTTVMKDVDEFRKSMLEMDDEELKSARERGISNYIEIGYAVEIANVDLISLSFGNSSYSGGAHPNSYSYSINFDLKTGKMLKLGDLFQRGSNYLKVISDYAIADLNKQMGSINDEWITRGAGPTDENFKSWTLTKDGLHINFDSYQVASYAHGPQEVTIPFTQLTSILRVLDFEPLRFANNGNPVNWCRNGLFPQDGEDLRVATVTGQRNEKVFFYNDDPDDCPDKPSCKTRSYVIPGNELIVSRTYGTYACSWYQPKKGGETVGWIPRDKLSIAKQDSNLTLTEWLGDWEFYDSSIEIRKGRNPGYLKITGTAFWKGFGDNIHIGELDDEGAPAEDKMSFGGSDEYDCRVKMQRVGRYLIVSDNLNCGGMNVTFNGVYRKK